MDNDHSLKKGYKRTNSCNKCFWECVVWGKIWIFAFVQLYQRRDGYSNYIIGGDFNAILGFEEKWGRSHVQDPFHERMEYLINDLDLVDIPPKVKNFTWTNRTTRNNYIASCLDKFLIHSRWFLNGLDCSSSIIKLGNSNHCLYPYLFLN